MADFPTALPDIPDASVTETLFTMHTGIGHVAATNRILDNILALATKLGYGASAPAAGAAVLRRTANGQSAWGQVLSGDIAPGAIGMNELGQAGVSALMLLNPIINGDFNVWQRGTTFANIGTGAYSADRWVYNKGGGTSVVHTVLADANVPALSLVSPPSSIQRTALTLDVTAADATIASGEYATIGQKIEGFNFQPIAQQPFVLSFWVKSSKTGTHCVSFRNSGLDRTYVGTYTVNAANVWEYKTILVPASPSAGTWDYGNGVGLWIDWVQAAGPSVQGTAGSWQSGSFIATTAQVNVCDSTANFFSLSQVQISPGASPLPFIARPYGLEHVLSERYWEQTYNPGVAAGSATQQGVVQTTCDGTNTNQIPGARFRTVKRAGPTIFIYSPNGTLSVVANVSFADAVGGITPLADGQSGFRAMVTAGAFLASTSYVWHFTANAEL